MRQKNKTILFIIAAGCFLTTIIYIFNSEKLYPEFWLQKKIKNYSCIEPIKNIELTGENLTYKFYDSSGIDVEISLYDIGYATLSLNKWFKDNSNITTYTVKADRDEIKNLISHFKNSYSESKFDDVEDHIGGRYYIFKYQGDKSIDIAFYNTNPDNGFKTMKSKIMKFGNDLLNQL